MLFEKVFCVCMYGSELGRASFRKAICAEAGSPDANFKLGVMYANGEGVPKDLRLAVRYICMYISIAACEIGQATNWDP